ncbi:MAG: tetratricopeptide repeat protein [Hyphomonadaceae bacterium]|nr:tetratricopeptide repeat protein [Hyphomonadaceae bacterium]
MSVCQEAKSQTSRLVEDRPALCLHMEEIRAEIESTSGVVEGGVVGPEQKVRALGQRASLHFLCERDVDAAVADIDAALLLSPGDPALLRIRAAYLTTAGYANLAMEDLDRAVMLEPNSPLSRRARGIAYLHLAQYQEAATDLQTTLLLNPAQPYAALELHIARLHLNAPDAEEFARNTARFSVHEWPAPLLAYYRGEVGEEDVLRLASREADRNGAGQRCEAAYYTGQSALVEARTSRARALFQEAAEGCPFDFSERGGALEELSRLP